jgi:hypothetical protein
MSDTDELLDHLLDTSNWEVDHAITIYLEPGKRLPWRDTKKIRECGYKIQDVTNSEYQTEITLVRNDSGNVGSVIQDPTPVELFDTVPQYGYTEHDKKMRRVCNMDLDKWAASQYRPLENPFDDNHHVD